MTIKNKEIFQNLKPGIKLNNKEVCEIFLCSPQGGMRRSLKTNCLVLVSNHIKSIYDDRWVGDILHYTGMGTKGDQCLNFSQNRTLNESRENNISIYLFEVFKEKEYTFTGEVRLIDNPYTEVQTDENDNLRKVWVFPIQLVCVEHS